MADQPGDESLGSCFAPIIGLWFGPRAAVSDDVVTMISSAREYYAFDEPQTADPIDPRGGNAQLVDERELVPAEYVFLQLDTGGVGEPLVDGSSTTVETQMLFTDPSTPGNTPARDSPPTSPPSGANRMPAPSPNRSSRASTSGTTRTEPESREAPPT